MGQSGEPVGLQAHRSGGVQKAPVVRPNAALSARDGSSAPGERKTREQSSPVWSTGDQRHLSGERSCRTAGCERALCRRRLPRGS
jgi:hypothetical protein